MLPPVLIFIRTEGREGKRERCTHTHVSTSLRFVRLNLEFVSKFSHYFFRSPFCARAPKIPLRESKEDFESTEIRILRFRAIYPRNERRTFINKIANARFRSIARSIAKLELLGSSSINWRRCTDGSVVIFFRPYNFQNFLAPCPRGRNIIDRERCIGVRMAPYKLDADGETIDFFFLPRIDSLPWNARTPSFVHMLARMSFTSW